MRVGENKALHNRLSPSQGNDQETDEFHRQNKSRQDKEYFGLAPEL